MFRKKLQNLLIYSPKYRFNMILDFAQEVIKANNKISKEEDFENNSKTHPIIDVIRLVGRKIQVEYLTQLLYEKNESRLASIDFDSFFINSWIPLSQDGSTLNSLKTQLKIQREVYLSRDLILPWPWKRTRLINCITTIGEGRIQGKWKQDKSNHYIELWLPLGLSWVEGGNHSITAGIIQGVGKIRPEFIYDISKLYKYVHCDGRYYYRTEDKSIICSVKNVEMAAIFEIGRLMIDNNISY